MFRFCVCNVQRCILKFVFALTILFNLNPTGSTSMRHTASMIIFLLFFFILIPYAQTETPDTVSFDADDWSIGSDTKETSSTKKDSATKAVTTVAEDRPTASETKDISSTLFICEERKQAWLNAAVLRGSVVFCFLTLFPVTLLYSSEDFCRA